MTESYPIIKDYNHQNVKKEYDLVYIGDITEDRGALIMIKTLLTLKKSIPKINLALIGKVPPVLEDVLITSISRNGLENNIQLMPPSFITTFLGNMGILFPPGILWWLNLFPPQINTFPKLSTVAQNKQERIVNYS